MRIVSVTMPEYDETLEGLDISHDRVIADIVFIGISKNQLGWNNVLDIKYALDSLNPRSRGILANLLLKHHINSISWRPLCESAF